MSTKSKGALVTKKLKSLEADLGINYSTLATVFLIERLVGRLTASEALRSILVFKGGFVSLRVYQSDRYTVDLDAILLKSNIKATLKQIRAAAEREVNDGVWFHHESEVDLETQGEYGGIRQVFRAGIGPKTDPVSRAQIINFDLGFGDPVTPGPVALNTPSLIAGEDISWSVYPIETMIAEKIHALVSLGEFNSRSKDVYDLSIFLPKAISKTLSNALKKCFQYRQTNLPENLFDELSSLETKNLQRGWKSALSSVPNAPGFHESFETILSEIARIESEF